MKQNKLKLLVTSLALGSILACSINAQEVAMTFSRSSNATTNSSIVNSLTNYKKHDFFIAKESSIKRNGEHKPSFIDTVGLSSIPFQLSLVPGLSTHGKRGEHIINNFSLNVLGGKTGGVSGLEIGGLFNINTGYVKSVQLAGLFNLTSSYVEGLQLAGIHNQVAGNTTGLQVGGIDNFVKGSIKGLQLAGIYNHVNENVEGLQFAGIANYARNKVKGMQVAGIANFSKVVNGIQVGGIFNYAKKLHGWQIGLINVADSSDGYSIGLLNFVPNGYHKLVVSSNEIFEANLAYKSGNKKLYTILLGGISNYKNYDAFAFGLGIGTEIPVAKMFSLNPEISSQYVYLGSFRDYNSLNRLSLDLHVKFGKHLSIFGGPALSGFYAETLNPFPGYKTLPGQNMNTFKVARNVVGWLGWNAGISFF